MAWNVGGGPPMSPSEPPSGVCAAARKARRARARGEIPHRLLRMYEMRASKVTDSELNNRAVHVPLLKTQYAPAMRS